MGKRFDDILSECIRRLETSGQEIESVLSRYPEHADELRPYLEIWRALSAVRKAQASREGAMRGRQHLLTAIASAEQPQRGARFINRSAVKGALAMRFVASMRIAAVFVAGAGLALGSLFLTGNLGFGGDSPAAAEVLPECLASLDFNNDGKLTVEDVLAFKDGIENQDPAFDIDGDGDVDISDVVGAVAQVVDCFQNQQPPVPAPPGP